jgi:ATP-dependent Clp protease ATP-binding subunit ClpC
MADTFERFTERARTALTLAQDEAVRHRHGYIGTKHLLVGLLAGRGGTAADALAELGLGVEDARRQLDMMIDEGEQAPLGEMGLTAQAKQAIRASVEEADRLGHRDVGTEHLLLGLLADADAVAVRIVESLGASRRDLRQAITRRL